ncbi:MAG TPA: hypothetical protein VE710_11830 [Candidatus Bathyarchaeia archaeon]|nr:hypothetical protein [Candidatus Bathyarchaeia archaeon]
MKERNILAGFRSMDDANKAAQQLKQAGFQTVQVDNVGQYPGEGIPAYMNPITGRIPSLGDLTQGADFPTGRDASVMAAADPAASGMADKGDDPVRPTILLTAVVPENRGDEAANIIRSCGGEV